MPTQMGGGLCPDGALCLMFLYNFFIVSNSMQLAFFDDLNLFFLKVSLITLTNRAYSANNML